MKTFRRLFVFGIILAGLLVAWPSSVRAQSPNLEAHRLYFVAVSSWIDKDPDTAARAIRSYLNTAGIAESEHVQAFQALAKFRNRYAALIESYNHAGMTLAGTNDDTPAFLAMRDMLVQETVDLLQGTLSKQSFENLERQVTKDGLRIQSSQPIARHRHATGLLPVQGGMTPHYSASRSMSVYFDANNNATVYEVPVVDGYTDCSGCTGIQHQGVVTNTLGSPYPVKGPWVTPTSYISVTNSGSAQYAASCFQAGASCASDDWTEESHIQCTRVGAIYEWGGYWGFKFTMHPAIVFSKANSGGPGKGWYQVSNWCKPEDSPPDLSMYVIQQNQDFTPTFFETLGLVVNTELTPGVWLPSPGLSQGLTGSWDLQYCTKTTPPY